MYRHLCVLTVFILFTFLSGTGFVSAEKTETLQIPPSVVHIGKENTVPHSETDLSYLQPSEFTKELLDTSAVKIDNPHLIKMLNESAINASPFSIGVRATIYLGEWPLNYTSKESVPVWQYQKINTNFYDNRGGTANYQIHYVQEAQKTVKGALTAKIDQPEEVGKMMLITAMEKTKLPLAFQTVIGAGTKHHQVYNIPPKQLGYLYAYAPALHEKGEVTYGEVYVVMKGMKRKLEVKNVTSQPIGAWIPIHSHLHYSFKGTK